ncbi:hypothetical protein Lal_00045906 [Lupinus albus]|nr:hypothetical protein Lal_00045906 [Lupinus albus]
MINNEGHNSSWKDVILNRSSFPTAVTENREILNTQSQKLGRKWIKSSEMKNTGGNRFSKKSRNGTPQFNHWKEWCGFSIFGFWLMLDWRIFFKVALEEVGELIWLDEDTINMTRLDIARCLVASSSMHHINLTQTVSIGEKDWEIRVIEDNVGEPCKSCQHDRLEKVDLLSSTSVESEDGEWWMDIVISG